MLFPIKVELEDQQVLDLSETSQIQDLEIRDQHSEIWEIMEEWVLMEQISKK